MYYNENFSFNENVYGNYFFITLKFIRLILIVSSVLIDSYDILVIVV